MLAEKWNFFGPTCAGHTLDAYRRLPFGWQTKPTDTWSDLHMWRQWLEQPWAEGHYISFADDPYFAYALASDHDTR